ncbi:MAG: 2OG-Fe(II) oxygenase [Sideroxydans sp.]|nr:2OG-Fe(II) oxygenase [Sideroxydans sp.]
MNILHIANALQETGYIVLDTPLPAALLDTLLARCQHDDEARFHAAQIGRGAQQQHQPTIRGDSIAWLDEQHANDQSYLAWMDTLRAGLNAELFLGLFDFEAHYAIYAAGTGYAKHVDALQGAKNRVLSSVLYLNADWHSGDGGELLLFASDGVTVLETLTPRLGTMILFLSETFPHQVLPSLTTRRSIAGWFRVRS